MFRNAIFVSTVLSAALAVGQALPKGVEKVTSIEGITEYKLSNGGAAAEPGHVSGADYQGGGF